jgi:hypothetical protein
LRPAALLLLTLAMGASVTQAQTRAPDDDPIAALLLDHRGDADEPDTAGQKVARPDNDPSLAGLPPVTPQAPPPRLRSPAYIQETGKTADAPPTPRDVAYDSRIRASFASAKGFQGPLEGGWTLAARGGADLYALQLVDRRDRLEGAWRDLRRPGALNASGLVDDIQHTGDALTLRITPSDGGPPVVATLHGDGGSGWTGELANGSDRRAVLLKRAGP